MKKNIFENWKKKSAEPALNKIVQIKEDIQKKLDAATKAHTVKHEKETIEEIKQAEIQDSALNIVKELKVKA